MFIRNKRKYTRKIWQAQGWIAGAQTDTWIEIKMVDISKGGFAFVSKEMMPLDSMQSFRFHLPDSSRVMKFIGRITHCIERPYGDGFRVGIEFKTIDIADLATIEWLVENEQIGKAWPL
ncbi:MAG: PilZ domain-containing protein, partial [Burkholderiaceae bacterium]